ncbi:hypothetical protein [Moellerella wisconsensis]|uniref:Secreted protein n=1 Tax=Moellerella wisconsensis ATCC 35017 TaxID=1354267 RepID=A0A0N0I9Z9_9GAMM|nr:hypothetical protein [Moellerella wisconsensis]KPD02613.1 hypothetical protein M992_1768 [Moellerella wisconsensis ATCC 35017]VFS53123.1 Uncharacterised protein [Moellerella wisconsensis]
MKRLLLSLCLVPVLSFAANEPLKISQTAVDYCDITGDVLAQAYSTNKSAQELIDTALVKVKSEQLDLSKLKSNQAALQKDLQVAIQGIRDNKTAFATKEDFTKSLNDSVSACKIQTELLLNK